MEDPSWASSPAVRKIMQGNRSRDTKPELAVRRAVHALGLRYRVAQRPLPDLRRRADLVFFPIKVAVFVDGCFWHGCPEHYRAPSSHPAYWHDKIAGNRVRDLETVELLTNKGWAVLRFWTHDDPLVVAEEIRSVVEQRRNDLARLSSSKSRVRGPDPMQPRGAP
jgi:DNA mismatch endonuclease (patch repair protein)